MQWIEINGFPSYQISDCGLVRNSCTGRMISTKPRNDGYVSVIMSDPSGKKKRAYAHRLVASHYIGQIPDGFTINHLNFNKSDNRIANLEIVSQRENINHARDAGCYVDFGNHSPRGDLSPHSKLSGEEVLKIRELHSSGYSYKRLASIFGVSNVQIRNIITRKSWKHI